MLRSAVLAIALLWAVPAVPEQPVQVPVDLAARAKFPRSDGELVDKIAFINRVVNTSMKGESDQEHYGVEDYWVMAPTDAKGDCEDYALTKIFILQREGWPIVTNTKLVGVIVHRVGRDDEGHAILAVRLPSKEVAYLDNMNAEPMTRRELVARGYQFFDWKA
jgi:predicted transglutaminase-like cysteine proteinase